MEKGHRAYGLGFRATAPVQCESWRRAIGSMVWVSELLVSWTITWPLPVRCASLMGFFSSGLLVSRIYYCLRLAPTCAVRIMNPGWPLPVRCAS